MLCDKHKQLFHYYSKKVIKGGLTREPSFPLFIHIQAMKVTQIVVLL